MKGLVHKLLPVVFLMGCMNSPTADQKALVEAQTMKASRVFIARQRQMIPKIDDGISDASTVALALTNACLVEYNAVTETFCQFGGLDNEQQYKMFRRKRNSLESKIEDSLPIVLEYRSSKKR